MLSCPKHQITMTILIFNRHIKYSSKPRGQLGGMQEEDRGGHTTRGGGTDFFYSRLYLAKDQLALGILVEELAGVPGHRSGLLAVHLLPGGRFLVI